jgi:hypothetical protein
MNDWELNKAVWLDLATIYKSSTIPRLRAEYDRERRRNKISQSSMYPRFYSIRTKTKNNWLIFLEKAPVLPKYRGEQDITFHCLAYYYGPKGLTVFKPDDDALLMYVYQAHVFTRYSERMQLTFSFPLEKVQHFFTYNVYSDHRFIERKDRHFSVGICRDGVLLGEYRKEVKWVFNRTFVNRGIFSRYQDLAELQVMEETTAWTRRVMDKKVTGDLVFKKANMTHAIFVSQDLS